MAQPPQVREVVLTKREINSRALTQRQQRPARRTAGNFKTIWSSVFDASTRCLVMYSFTLFAVSTSRAESSRMGGAATPPPEEHELPMLARSVCCASPNPTLRGYY